MRDMPPEALDALAGDRSGDRLLVTPWYDGQATTEGPLDVASWSIDWDRSRQIQGQVSIEVADPDGSLSPWRVDDVLGVGGARLSCTLRLGSTESEVELGTFRITGVDVSQSMHSQRVARITEHGTSVIGDEVSWSWAGTVSVEAQDETVGASLATFVAPERVVHSSSAISEIRRLMEDIVPVEAHPDLQDSAVPASITYEGGRIDALGSLVRALEAQYRMHAEGYLYLIPAAPGEPVWDIAPGEMGVLVDFARSFRTSDLPNVMVVEGSTDDEDRPLIGVARESSGPLSYDGPHGLVPSRRQANILTSQARVDRAATTYLRTAIHDRSMTLPITCLPHPGLEAGDVVRLDLPGGTLAGPVETIRLSGSASGMSPMEITMTVDYEQLVTMVGGRRG